MNKTEILSKIKQIIRNECDGTFNNSDTQWWNFSTPEESPKIIFDEISELFNEIDDTDN